MITIKRLLKFRKNQSLKFTNFSSSKFRDDLWEKGLNNKEKEFLKQSDMVGHNEKFYKDFIFMEFKGGKGGTGAISHEATRLKRKGRPIGGSGGKGGDIYIKSVWNNPDFSYIRSKHINGNPGKDGKNNGSNGKNGKDLHYSVPIGTIAYEVNHKEIVDEETGEIKTKRFERYLGELNKFGESLRIVRGGKGTQGNLENREKKIREPGQEGETRKVKLEVRMIADIGLIGFPNAGKSTLLASITRSKPRIASYEFTTLNPNLGQLNFIDNNNITIADIPGLIKGSSENRGLGHQFLSHCLKSKAICYVIDSSLEQAISPWEQYETLKQELITYNEDFRDKIEIIVGSKCDLPGSYENMEEFKKQTGKDMILISAKESFNLSHLVRKMREVVHGDAEDGPLFV